MKGKDQYILLGQIYSLFVNLLEKIYLLYIIEVKRIHDYVIMSILSMGACVHSIPISIQMSIFHIFLFHKYC